MSDKVKENRVRRLAARQGLLLVKSRRRDPNAFDFGGYMLVDAETNGVVAGSSPGVFSLSLDDAEARLAREVRPVHPNLVPFLRDLRRRIVLARERIEMMKSGKMSVRENTGTGWTDVTGDAVANEERMISADEAVLAEWDPAEQTA